MTRLPLERYAPAALIGRVEQKGQWRFEPIGDLMFMRGERKVRRNDGDDRRDDVAGNGAVGLDRFDQLDGFRIEEKLLTITMDEALRIYAQPKQRGRGAATAPLKELGNDPVSGQPVVVKAGRFGEYVTDGEYNATLRRDDTVEAITLERAAELLAERRAKGPAKKTAKKGAKKTAAKKTAKKSGAKKTAKKTAKKS